MNKKNNIKKNTRKNNRQNKQQSNVNVVFGIEISREGQEMKCFYTQDYKDYINNDNDNRDYEDFFESADFYARTFIRHKFERTDIEDFLTDLTFHNSPFEIETTIYGENICIRSQLLPRNMSNIDKIVTQKKENAYTYLPQKPKLKKSQVCNTNQLNSNFEIIRTSKENNLVNNLELIGIIGTYLCKKDCQSFICTSRIINKSVNNHLTGGKIKLINWSLAPTYERFQYEIVFKKNNKNSSFEYSLNKKGKEKTFAIIESYKD